MLQQTRSRPTDVPPSEAIDRSGNGAAQRSGVDESAVSVPSAAPRVLDGAVARDEVHPGPQTAIREAKATFELITMQAVARAEAAAAAIREAAAAEVEHIQREANTRTARMLFDVERLCTELVDEARAAAERAWIELDRVDGSTPGVDPAPTELPPICWHPPGWVPRDDARALSASPATLLEKPVVTPLLPVDDMPAAPAEWPATSEPIATVDADTSSLTPPSGDAESITVPQRPRRGRRKLALVVALVVVVAGGAAAAAWWPSRDGGSRHAAPALPAGTVPASPLTKIDAARFQAHWAQEVGALAPPGSTLSTQGTTDPLGDPATAEQAKLAERLQAGESAAYTGEFTSAARRSNPPVTRASATLRAYASEAGAARAFDTVKAYFSGGERTSRGDRALSLPPNVALRSFAYAQGTADARTYTAYLQLPGFLVELHAGGPDENALLGMISVVASWER